MRELADIYSIVSENLVPKELTRTADFPNAKTKEDLSHLIRLARSYMYAYGSLDTWNSGIKR
jgi:hypothetical protein